jgi:hypothetical protein
MVLKRPTSLTHIIKSNSTFSRKELRGRSSKRSKWLVLKEPKSKRKRELLKISKRRRKRERR